MGIRLSHPAGYTRENDPERFNAGERYEERKYKSRRFYQ
jgi:hypothetical protein